MSHDDSKVIHNFEEFQPPLGSVIIEYIAFILSLAAFIYGVTSWCLLRKFRTFKNYAYINAVFTSLLRLTVLSIIPPYVQNHTVNNRVLLFLSVYFVSAENYWLLVICCIFYFDIVKVFNTHTDRRYLKSTVFAYCFPILTSLISTFVFPMMLNFRDGGLKPEVRIRIYVSLKIGFMILPVFMNLFIYVKVVYSLFRVKSVSGGNSNKMRRFYIATLIFVLSNIVVLSSFVWDMLFHFPVTLQTLLINLQSMTIAIFLPIVRCNRVLWKEYLVNFWERYIM